MQPAAIPLTSMPGARSASAATSWSRRRRQRSRMERTCRSYAPEAMNSARVSWSGEPETRSARPFAATTSPTRCRGSTIQPNRSPGASDLLAVPR